MRQDWVEFKKNETNSMSLRPEYIIGISEFSYNPEENSREHTRILYDIGGSTKDIAIIEPYEQVKQKIMDAEKVDLNDVVVEHFTKEEYERLQSCVNYYRENSTWYVDHKETQKEINNLLSKLKEILKEEDE